MSLKIEEIHQMLPKTDRGRHLHDICAELGLKPKERPVVEGLLHQLCGYYLATEVGSSVFRRAREEVTGTLTMNAQGFGFVSVELSDASNIYIDRHDLEGALHRDRVRVKLYTATDGRLRGRITQTLERGTQTCVGIYRKEEDRAFIYPQNNRLPSQIIVIAPTSTHRVEVHPKDGDLVAALLGTREAMVDQPIEDELTAVVLHLIDPTAAQGALEAVIYDQGLALHLPAITEEAASQFSEEISPDEILRRRDLRHLPFMTIDPESAQDFDDALYAQPQTEGGWLLWVAIADVAHYVPEGGVIDEHAQKKSATLYLPAQAFPMLPHYLSNNLCSLKPKRDRLAMVVKMEVTPQGEIENTKFYESVIHSQARFTYDQAASLIGILPSRDLPKHLSSMYDHVQAIRDCARALKLRRRRRGFLNLDLIEPRLQFNMRGGVEGFKVTPRHEAHEMVEEAMLAANESVATHCIEHEIPALYRLHPIPPDRGIDRFVTQSKLLGAPFEPAKKVKAHHLSKYLKHHEEHDRAELLSSLLLRAMARASYDPSSGLHFGLGTETYLHFTSPIRRYPDLWVHRQLKRWLQGEVIAKPQDAHEVAAYSSRCERLILEAERKVMDAYKALYMTEHIGARLKGVVCQTSPKGFIVDLDDYPVWCTHDADRLPGGFRYNEATFTWSNITQHRKIALGAVVEVEILNTSVREGRVEIGLLNL